MLYPGKLFHSNFGIKILLEQFHMFSHLLRLSSGLFSRFKRKGFLYLIIKHWLILWCQIRDGSGIFTGTDRAIAFNMITKLSSSSVDFIIWPQGTVGISWWDQGYLCSEGDRVAPGGKVCVTMNKKTIRKYLRNSLLKLKYRYDQLINFLFLDMWWQTHF